MIAHTPSHVHRKYPVFCLLLYRLYQQQAVVHFAHGSGAQVDRRPNYMKTNKTNKQTNPQKTHPTILPILFTYS